MAIPRVQTAATIRAAALRRGAQLFRARTASIPPPVGGWNARDSLADMDEDDAVALTNWFPSTTEVMTRYGYTRWAEGFSGYCESLMVYNGPTGSQMIAAVETNFYDVSVEGAVGAAVQTGLTNARWQFANFSTAGGSFMYCVNGADSARLFDGTNWSTITAISVPIAITGVTTASLNYVNVFKRRLWFVERNSLKVWYLPVDSIGGAAEALNFNSLAGLGGHLVAMGTWTVDSGTGPDDLAVFVTSQGQVIVYRGIDPANEVTWALAGVWNVGSPIGARCLQKWGGDLLILTYDGVFQLSSYLKEGQISLEVALSDKIRSAMSEAVAQYAVNFGWDMLVFPKANMLIVNVPVTTGTYQQQYVMNTISKSWCNFTGWEANCWALFGDNPYFGGNGFVAQAWDGARDDQTNIPCAVQQAFNYFGARGQEKRFTFMRPIFRADDYPTIYVNICVDYESVTPTNLAAFNVFTLSQWDSAIWDTNYWGGDVILRDWQGINGMGYCASITMLADIANMHLRWLSTDMVMEPGGVI